MSVSARPLVVDPTHALLKDKSRTLRRVKRRQQGGVRRLDSITRSSRETISSSRGSPLRRHSRNLWNPLRLSESPVRSRGIGPISRSTSSRPAISRISRFPNRAATRSVRRRQQLPDEPLNTPTTRRKDARAVLSAYSAYSAVYLLYSGPRGSGGPEGPTGASAPLWTSASAPR